MSVTREGYHELIATIPEVLWQKLCADAQNAGVSAAKVLTGILRKHYKVSKNDLSNIKKACAPSKADIRELDELLDHIDIAGPDVLKLGKPQLPDR